MRPGRARRRWRLVFLALGVALLLWLPYEDTHLGWVFAFALSISGLAAAQALDRRGIRKARFAYPLSGFLAGLAVTPIALLLIAVKTGAHGHPAPDFTSAQILEVARRTPAWAAAGLLVGAGLAVFAQARQKDTRDIDSGPARS